MGLLTKEVEVNITSRNVEYFENLGYTIPRVYDKGKHKYIFKKGTTIIVKVSDLRKNSMRNVDIECDNCHTIITQPFEAYNKYKKEDGNYYCGDCASRLFTSGKKHYRWKSDLTDEEIEEFALDNINEMLSSHPDFTSFIMDDGYGLVSMMNGIFGITEKLSATSIIPKK